MNTHERVSVGRLPYCRPFNVNAAENLILDSNGNWTRTGADDEMDRADELQTHPVRFTVDELIRLWQTWDGDLKLEGSIANGEVTVDQTFGRPSQRVCRCPFWYIDIDEETSLAREDGWDGNFAEPAVDGYVPPFPVDGVGSGFMRIVDDDTGPVSGWNLQDPPPQSSGFEEFVRDVLRSILLNVTPGVGSFSGYPMHYIDEQSASIIRNQFWSTFGDGEYFDYAVKSIDVNAGTAEEKLININWINVEFVYAVDYENYGSTSLRTDRFSYGSNDLGEYRTAVPVLTTDNAHRAKLRVEIQIKDPDPSGYGDQFFLSFGSMQGFIDSWIADQIAEGNPSWSPSALASHLSDVFDDGMRFFYQDFFVRVGASSAGQLPWSLEPDPGIRKPSAAQIMNQDPPPFNLWVYDSEDFWGDIGLRQQQEIVNEGEEAIWATVLVVNYSEFGGGKYKIFMDMMLGNRTGREGVLWNGDEQKYCFRFQYEGYDPAFRSGTNFPISTLTNLNLDPGWWSTVLPISEQWQGAWGNNVIDQVLTGVQGDHFYNPLSPPLQVSSFYRYLIENWNEAVLFIDSVVNDGAQDPIDIIYSPPSPQFLPPTTTVTLRFTDEFEFEINVWRLNAVVDFEFRHPDD